MGVNCQEASYDELLESLNVTLNEALEFDHNCNVKYKIIVAN
jgi:hypothetical protein